MTRAPGEESTDVVEMDAMDVVEWERDQHTPVAPDSVRADLVKQSSAPERPPVPSVGRNTRSAMPVPLSAKPAAGLPRATAPKPPVEAAAEAPASRVPNATIPTPQPLMQQLLKSPTKHTTQRAPRLSSETVPTPPAIQQAIVRRERGESSIGALPVAEAAADDAPKPVVAGPQAGSDGWEDLDDAWDESPKPITTKSDAKAYSAPTVPRTATTNTFRRNGTASPARAGAATPAAAPKPTAPRVGIITEPMPTVARPRPAEPGTPANGAAHTKVTRANGAAQTAQTASTAAATPQPVKPRETKLPSIATPKPVEAKPAAPFVAPIARRDDDWDGLAPSKPSQPAPKPNPKPISRPTPDFGEDDADAEPSVIIDLNAKPVVPPPDMDQDLAALALAADAIAGPGPRAPIYTSEESTTASGVFVMPTAAAPIGRSISARTPAAAAPVVAPTAPAPVEDAADDADDLAVPSLAAPPWDPPPAAAFSPPAPGGWDRPAADPVPSAAWPQREALPYGSADGSLAPAKPPGVAFAFAPQAQQSAPLPRAPSVAELGWDHDPAIPQPLAQAEQTERRFVPAPPPRSKRLVVIIAAAAALIVVLLVVVLGGGGKSSAPAEPPVAIAAATPEPEPAPAPVAKPDPTPVAPAKPDAVAATEPPAVVEPVAPAPPVAKPTGRRPSRPAKPLVLDYDKPKADAGPTPPSPDEALSRARAAYAKGNQHLFAGEADAAIGAYKQALAVYPGYVAGYRGLGLAYAQSGDREAALKAFKTYVGLVPNAKDAALIQKRIARLSPQ